MAIYPIDKYFRTYQLYPKKLLGKLIFSVQGMLQHSGTRKKTASEAKIKYNVNVLQASCAKNIIDIALVITSDWDVKSS